MVCDVSSHTHTHTNTLPTIITPTHIQPPLSQVKCSSCGYESNTFDPFLDVSLEVNKVDSLRGALQRFTAGEVLDGDNCYKCPKQVGWKALQHCVIHTCTAALCYTSPSPYAQNKLVRAVKRMTLHKAPNVLVLQLKRFEFMMFGHKIMRKIHYPNTLDIAPYMVCCVLYGCAVRAVWLCVACKQGV